jgi:tRNA(Ile)-lysidine synthase
MIGYSGGLDSSVLLHLLADLRKVAGFSLSAVHVHHGLSPHADSWAQHCTKTCLTLAVPLAVHHVDVRLDGSGLEAAARAARYRVYAGLDTDFVVLAHHRDDQAETVLLQLLRGSGIKGLAAMPESRNLVAGIALLRPLLAVSREELAVWASQFSIGWIEDESNADVRLTRNALRHEVMPKLSAHFPTAPQVLAHAAAMFAETTSLLDVLAELDAQVVVSADGLAVARLRELPEARARNVLRRFLVQSGVEIHQALLHEALRQVLTAKPDAQVRVDFGAVSLRLYRQCVVLDPVLDPVRKAAAGFVVRSMRWNGEPCLDLDGAGRLHFQAATGQGVKLVRGHVTIRQRQGGESLRPGPSRPRRTLKNVLRESGVPAWQRQALPLVFVDDVLVWAAGIGEDSDYLAKPGEPGWLISWQAPMRPR